MSTKTTDAVNLVSEAEGLLAGGHFEDVEQLCQRALVKHPDNARLFAARGRAAQARGRYADAAGWLEQAAKGLEDDPDLWNDLGRALNNLRELERAETAFLRALACAPKRADIHNNLGHVYRARGKLHKATASLEEAIRLDPGLVGAHNNLGTVCMLMRQPLEAARHFRRASELAPDDARCNANLGLALQTAGRLQPAREAYERALGIQPGAADTWIALGLTYNELRMNEAALQAFERARALGPEDPRPYAELAALYEDLNRLAEAEATVGEGLQRTPDDPRINLEAAKLARRNGDPSAACGILERFDRKRMDGRLAQMFAYELGLNKDRTGAADEAFECFREANAHARKSERLLDVDPARFRARIDRTREFFLHNNPDRWTTVAPDPARESPVFLFGFPRSGTTLTDLLLDNHPEIVTLEEKPTIEKLVIGLMRHEKGYPEALAVLNEEEILGLRREYFAEVARNTKEWKGMTIVDKMPIRTVNAGLIWRLFPDSRVIFSVRHPCDVCISCFMQQFNANDAFANFFTLEDTVRVYDKVMSLWQVLAKRLPLNVHLVRYEDLITDLEGQSRSLMEFLGKAWQPELMDYRKRAFERGRIATNSYHQVTEPLYTRAMGRWQRYARYLEPHLPALRPHMRFLGYPEA